MEENKPVADVWSQENNCIVAVYVVNSLFINQEPRELQAIPFLFYIGTFRHDPVGRLIEHGVHFGTIDELHALQALAVQGGRCDHAEVEKKIPWMMGCYVPYSFGVGHESDVRENRRVRTRKEYDEFMVLLWRAHANRHQQAEAAARQAAYDAKLGTKIRRWFRELLPKTV